MLGIRAFATWSLRMVLRLALILFWVLATAVLAAGLLSYRTSARLAAANTDPSRVVLNPDESAALDFYQAAGMTRNELNAFLREELPATGSKTKPIEITLQNAQGDYLSQGRVLVRWNKGEYRLLIGDSGLLRFQLGMQHLDGLSIIPPTGFTILKQRSIPLGSAYEPEAKPVSDYVPSPIIWDGQVSYTLFERLAALQAEGRVIPYEELREQLRRERIRYAFRLPAPETAVLTPGALYDRGRASVVIVGTLTRGGGTRQASGVILSRDGLIATAYHVLDRPDAVSRGIMTDDGRVFAIEEVVAASRSDDVALLRIAARNLQPAPLSKGDPVGSEVLVLAHPAGAYFTLTEGRIARYWAATHHGRVSIKMSVTADFADGASGGPIFNRSGAVTGLVSWTQALGNQMVVRNAVPVAAIQALLESKVDRSKSDQDKPPAQPPERLESSTNPATLEATIPTTP
jgi:serine protease Do